MVLLVRLSKMHFRLPNALIQLLLDPRQAFATVNFKSGDGPALKRMLCQQLHAGAELLELDMRLPNQFDLDRMTRAGVDRWGSALFKADWKKQKANSKASWEVSFSSNCMKACLRLAAFAIHGNSSLYVCVFHHGSPWFPVFSPPCVKGKCLVFWVLNSHVP